MQIFYHFGKYCLFLQSMFSRPEKFHVYWERTMLEMKNIGIGSLAIVAIIAFFQGAVTTLQIAYQLVSPLVANPVIGSIVSDSSMLELAPTITCLVLAGNVGSHIASEIGTMRVGEQIDALDIMGINSAGFIALPKIIAGLVMIPALIIISIFLSNMGGIIAGQASGILTPDEYMQGARESFLTFNLIFSLIKAFTYAFIITSVSCYQGYYTSGGALEVGASSTKAVVYSAVLILFSDYILTQLLL
ncbi:MAG: phospholipid/cholesterol/gamma-HCH transport system permease protein [Bacteroidia bacterium]|jgi:phospholipid/cholesterol/gamma-HCH transport system permease protein